MSVVTLAVLFVSAFLAGLVNSVAGGGTILSFSALLWAGLDPRVANATSTMAVWPGSLGGALGYRGELEKSGPLLRRMAIPSLLGGGLGVWLLVLTPSSTFARLVPFLILFATILFMVQDSISQKLRGAGPSTPLHTMGAMIFQFLVATYGGYFGAAMGILMLAMLAFIGVSDIHRANGIKNILALCINAVAAIGFLIAAHLVSWPAALLMMVAAILGGLQGAWAAHRLGRTVARRAVIVIGLALTLVMLWQQWF